MRTQAKGENCIPCACTVFTWVVANACINPILWWKIVEFALASLVKAKLKSSYDEGSSFDNTVKKQNLKRAP